MLWFSFGHNCIPIPDPLSNPILLLRLSMKKANLTFPCFLALLCGNEFGDVSGASVSDSVDRNARRRISGQPRHVGDGQQIRG